MLSDILTVMWKERKELFRFRGSRAKLLLNLLMLAAFAFWQPLRVGPEFVEQEGAVVLSALTVVILVLITAPNSFAGERERHTLETLLASRLPDRAVLLGKLAVSVAFAWGGALVTLLLSLITVNIAHWEGELILFTPTVGVAALGGSFLLATLSAGAGVLVSLRSVTVQEATQILTAIFLVPPMLLTTVLLLFHDQLRDLLGGLSSEQVLVVMAAALVAADLAVHAVAMARFRRERLCLD